MQSPHSGPDPAHTQHLDARRIFVSNGIFTPNEKPSLFARRSALDKMTRDYGRPLAGERRRAHLRGMYIIWVALAYTIVVLLLHYL